MRESLKMLESKHDLVGIEVGVFGGDHALVIVGGLCIRKLYLVDSYTKHEGYEQFTQEILDAKKAEAHKKLDMFKDKIVWVEKQSAMAVDDFHDESLDFVYLDADHEYAAALADMTLYYPKVKKGGLLCGHNYEPETKVEHVAKALHYFCAQNSLKFGSSKGSKLPTDWWIWK